MRRDEVYKAIRRAGPARVPIYLINRDQDQEEYHSIGLSEENYLAYVEAFRTLGKYPPRLTGGT